VVVKVEGLSTSSTPTSQLPQCKNMNEQGYWERVNRSSFLCSNGKSGNDQHPGECFVLDKVNPEWLWRGDNCHYPLFSPAQVIECFSNTSLVVAGDSLPAEVYHNLARYVPQAIGTRLFWEETSEYFGDNWNNKNRVPTTRRVFVVTNIRIAHLLWKQPMQRLLDYVIPEMDQRWSAVLNSTDQQQEIHGVYYTGYPAHFERERFITHDRMVKGNAILGKAAEHLGFSVLDTTIPLSSRPDAAWDGFHFLQTKDAVGGVSRMVTMILLNHICQESS
jgi:hypothetical protein